ncbi:MAG: aldehyde dehydrogenase family protein, partial [Gammaproteobacteria bacterium]|nr:aldehyde dehydrogenase family protein [Gammaproteobacteria bacterium]
MQNALKFYINGEWVDPITPNTLDVINPATEQAIGQISLGSTADVDRAVAAAKQAFKSYSRTSREERISYLEKILAGYKKRYDDLAQIMSQEMGAPLAFASNSQARAGYSHLNSALQALKTFEFEQELGDSQIVREPIGVCGLITPWNWPMNQIAHKVGPALACGCTIVLKPSEIAPLNAIIFAEIVDEAGLPPGVFNMVNGDGPTVGEAMSRHPDIDLMSFTGSTRAGRAVAHGSADTIKRVAQELGGKSPNIILDDADLDKSVKRDVLEMMSNTGQSCNAPSRMLVPVERLDEVKDIAVRAAQTIVVGDPEDENTTMGPLVSELQWNKVQALINKGIEEGCEVIIGGPGKPEGLETGYYARPTIFANVTNDKTIAVEEIFGPVFAILTYDNLDQAIDIANDTEYGLSAYISTTNIDRGRGVARKLRAGNVHINGQWGNKPTPFGGYKQSGNGREGGVFGFQDFL